MEVGTPFCRTAKRALVAPMSPISANSMDCSPCRTPAGRKLREGPVAGNETLLHREDGQVRIRNPPPGFPGGVNVSIGNRRSLLLARRVLHAANGILDLAGGLLQLAFGL